LEEPFLSQHKNKREPLLVTCCACPGLLFQEVVGSLMVTSGAHLAMPGSKWLPTRILWGRDIILPFLLSKKWSHKKPAFSLTSDLY